MIYLDIEAVPELQFLTDPLPPWFEEHRWNPKPKLKKLIDVSQYVKLATIAKYEAENVLIEAENERIVSEFDIIKPLSLNPFTAKPVCISYGKEDDGCVFSYTPPEDPNGAMNNDVWWDSQKELINQIWKNLPLVTFYGKTYDLYVLALYAARNGESRLARDWMNLLDSPYNHDRHLDLYTLFPNCPSLDVLGAYLKCETKKHGSGADIYRWVQEGRWGDVVKHCEADVRLLADCTDRLGYGGAK